MKIRLITDQKTCEHIWLSDLEGLVERDVSFIHLILGDVHVEWDICTVCSLIAKLERNYNPPLHHNDSASTLEAAHLGWSPDGRQP